MTNDILKILMNASSGLESIVHRMGHQAASSAQAIPPGLLPATSTDVLQPFVHRQPRMPAQRAEGCVRGFCRSSC